ncbi:MAG: 50S ribosomal protein L4 [Candidatus Gygaella obscura]|nr:50S ribosomal protein L4 [Candidatus Gygaella obscura]
MAQCNVLNIQGKKVESIELDVKLFDGKVNEACVYQAVVMYQANRRLGSASVKDRAQVSGGGAKPWKQKGTGRARHGSSRSPIWRHGGVTFGPIPRDFSYTLPKKIKHKALISVLNDKLNNKEIIFIDEIKIEKTKTKELVAVIKKLKIKGKCLLVADSFSNELFLSGRNIVRLQIKLAAELNAYDVLCSKILIITKKAFGLLEKRLKK